MRAQRLNLADAPVKLAAETNLRDIQRLWIKYRDAKCGFVESVYGSGTMIVPLTADCRMRETANRAIELAEWLNEAHALSNQ